MMYLKTAADARLRDFVETACENLEDMLSTQGASLDIINGVAKVAERCREDDESVFEPRDLLSTVQEEAELAEAWLAQRRAALEQEAAAARGLADASRLGLALHQEELADRLRDARALAEEQFHEEGAVLWEAVAHMADASEEREEAARVRAAHAEGQLAEGLWEIREECAASALEHGQRLAATQAEVEAARAATEQALQRALASQRRVREVLSRTNEEVARGAEEADARAAAAEEVAAEACARECREQELATERINEARAEEAHVVERLRHAMESSLAHWEERRASSERAAAEARRKGRAAATHAELRAGDATRAILGRAEALAARGDEEATELTTQLTKLRLERESEIARLREEADQDHDSSELAADRSAEAELAAITARERERAANEESTTEEAALAAALEARQSAVTRSEVRSRAVASQVDDIVALEAADTKKVEERVATDMAIAEQRLAVAEARAEEEAAAASITEEDAQEEVHQIEAIYQAEEQAAVFRSETAEKAVAASLEWSLAGERVAQSLFGVAASPAPGAGRGDAGDEAFGGVPVPTTPLAATPRTPPAKGDFWSTASMGRGRGYGSSAASGHGWERVRHVAQIIASDKGVAGDAAGVSTGTIPAPRTPGEAGA